MPRAKRVKNEELNYIYHVMDRSNSGIPLFRDNKDKDKFLSFIKKYQEKFNFKVYAYCLMTTHAHLIIDANCADISQFMQRINLCYALYFNTKYHRHGHVFQDRFKSKVVDKDSYLFALSAYIHNNPTSMKKYREHPEKFKYSTLGLYLGCNDDPYELVDQEFIMGLFSENVKKAREEYYAFVRICNDEKKLDTVEFKDEKSQYRSERKVLIRNFKPEDIIEFIAKYTGVSKELLHWKNKKEATKSRALCVFLIRYYCNFTFKQICGVIGGLTLSRISQLEEIGYNLIKEDERYKNIMNDFLKKASTSS